MIPRTIKREHVLEAINLIIKDGVPKKHESTGYYIKANEGESLPPKYVISKSHFFAHGIDLDTAKFNGGDESNSFLERLGFQIVPINTSNNSLYSMFNKHSKYTRNEIWKLYHPGQGDKPRGGNYDTGYVSENDELIAFLNINVAGRTGHQFENYYNEETELITWFGKPNTHSNQPLFRKLIAKEMTLHFFARWDSNNTSFSYLGTGEIIDFTDGVMIDETRSAIKMTVEIVDNLGSIESEGVSATSQHTNIPSFGKKMSVIVNRYERNPEFKRKCLEHFGHICRICGFSFERMFGKLGEQFCHVHHIEPIGEAGGEKVTDPITDLIPVCPNCHSMLHRKKPALKPEELKTILLQNKTLLQKMDSENNP